MTIAGRLVFADVCSQIIMHPKLDALPNNTRKPDTDLSVKRENLEVQLCPTEMFFTLMLFSTDVCHRRLKTQFLTGLNLDDSLPASLIASRVLLRLLVLSYCHIINTHSHVSPL